MAKEVNVGKAYFDVRAKKDKFKSDMNEVKKLAQQEAKSIQSKLNKFEGKFDNALMKMKLKDVEKYAVRLRAELQKKIKMNADVQSLERTKIKIRSVERALEGVQREATKTKSKMNGAFGGVMGKLTGLLGGMYALKKAWDISVQAKNAARDAEEMRSKFNTVFETIKDGANSSADAFARSFGVAGTTARTLLGATGDLLVGFGFTEDSALDLSLQVNTLAQDLASFTNFSGGANGASQALTKAILGETESVKALGIVLRQNTPEFKKQLATTMKLQGVNENQARAIVLLKEAYKQSGKAVGDYARTKDSLANVEKRADEQLKEALETVGTKLTPIFIKGTIGVVNFLRAFTENEMDTAIRRLSELGLEAEKLDRIISANTIKNNLKEIRDLTADIQNRATGQMEQNFDGELLERYRKTFLFFIDDNVDLGLKQGKLVTINERLIALYQRKADAKLKSEDTESVDNLIKMYEAQNREGKRIVGNYVRINQLKKENEEIKSPKISKDAGVNNNLTKEFEAAKGSVADLKTQISELEKQLEGTTESKTIIELDKKINDANNKLLTQLQLQENLKKELNKGTLGFKDAKPKDAEETQTDGFTRTPKYLDTVEEKFTNPIIDASDKFTDNMQGSLGVAGSIVSTLKSGLFKAGQGFLDYLGQGLGLASQVIGIVGSFSPGGVIASLFAHDGGTFQGGKKIAKYSSGTTQKIPYGNPHDTFPMFLGGAPAFGESGETVKVTPASQVGQTEKLLSQLIGLQKSAMAQQAKQRSTINNINTIDADSLVESFVLPKMADLNRQNVKIG